MTRCWPRSASPRPQGGYAYEKQKRKIGDYATAAAAVLLTQERRPLHRMASIAMTNLSRHAGLVARPPARRWSARPATPAAVDAAVAAMLGDIDPTEDNRGPVEPSSGMCAGVDACSRAIDRAPARRAA